MSNSINELFYLPTLFLLSCPDPISMAFSFINHFRRHPLILPCLYLCPYLLDAPLPRWSYTYAELLDFPSHFIATPLGSVSRQNYSFFFLRIDRHLLYCRISRFLLSIKSLSGQTSNCSQKTGNLQYNERRWAHSPRIRGIHDEFINEQFTHV